MVTPIAASHLQRAFEGSDSAYLLVYRQLEVPVDISAFLAQSRETLLQANKKVPPLFVLIIVLQTQSFL